MSIEAAPEQGEVQAESIAIPVPRSRPGKLMYSAFVLVIPLVAFWATKLFWPEWQNGELDSYVILWLSPQASWIFFPLLLYSILCYLLLLQDFGRYSTQFLVRFGIYTGVLSALQFSVLSGLYFYNANPSFLLVVLIWFFPILAAKLYAWATFKWDTEKVIISLIVMGVITSIVIVVITRTMYSPLLLLLVVLTIAAPFWCFLMFFRVAIWSFRNHETKITLGRAFGLTAWLGAYIFAWRFSILKMYELYAALPPQPPPDCYIATAAAQGHPRLVGARTVCRPDGVAITVNRQLQVLKCAELALMAVQPEVHAVVRRSYDVIGKAMAARIKKPLVADLAYLLLKPFEALAMFVLSLLIPEIEQIANKMYTS